LDVSFLAPAGASFDCANANEATRLNNNPNNDRDDDACNELMTDSGGEENERAV
jgi:hypothetical protein